MNQYIKLTHYYVINYELTDLDTICVSATPELCTKLISIIRSCPEEEAMGIKLPNDKRIGYPLKYQELLDLYQFCKDKEYDYATDNDAQYQIYKQAAEAFRNGACLRDDANFVHVAYYEEEE